MLALIERWLAAYKPTLRLHMTTYYFDVERKGRFTGQYQHRLGFTGEWANGKHPKYHDKD